MAMIDIDYARKPNKLQLLSAIRKGLLAGSDLIYLTWGENRIEVRVTLHGVIGSGWIGRNGGDDLVKALNPTRVPLDRGGLVFINK